MSQQTEAKETWVDLEKKLLPYQRAAVDKICKHFENSGKALLADEGGLGKTFVAKGVVAKLAAEHWENNQQPFRVAYICPNQNVAAQNYPKFTGMYSSGVEVSKNAADGKLPTGSCRAVSRYRRRKVPPIPALSEYAGVFYRKTP